ncbi:MAG: sodium:solute symporter family protein, partial [Saprospiraceae bacterium]|nr:sodium:solute symporter family protein [Saprospiraceae bacterium]
MKRTSKKDARTVLFSVLALLFLLGLLGGWLYFYSPEEVNWPAYGTMVVFYGLIFLVGLYARHWRQSEGSSGLLLAGRQLPLFLAIFTMSATWVGGGYINGTAEYTASSGLVWVQAPWGYAVSLILGGLFFARRMRRYQFRTMLDPLEQRYGKRMTAVLFLPALSGEIFWSAAILTALGTTFGTILGLETNTAILLSALIAIIYTAIGGLWAVALTDLVQMILLLGGLFLAVPFAMEKVGGWNLAWQTYQGDFGAAATLFPSREALGEHYFLWWDYALLLMLGGIPWQVYFQRVLAAKDEFTAQRLSIIAGFVCLLAAVPAVLIGIAGHAADWTSLQATVPPDAASTLPWVIRYLTSPWVAALGLGAVAAAVMSSTDSSILSAASMASWNIYRPLIKPDTSSAQLQKIIRRSIWIIGLTATFLALNIG